MCRNCFSLHKLFFFFEKSIPLLVWAQVKLLRTRCCQNFEPRISIHIQKCAHWFDSNKNWPKAKSLSSSNRPLLLDLHFLFGCAILGGLLRFLHNYGGHLTQARSQKFAKERIVLGVGGRSTQLPEANRGLGAKHPAAGGWGSRGKAPSRRRHGGLGAEPSALETLHFFAKIT